MNILTEQHEQPEHWDRATTKQLINMGLNWELARKVVGLLAEHRQQADREGYKRGFENGYESAVRHTEQKKGTEQ